jgi:HK97 family phage prohead protease
MERRSVQTDHEFTGNRLSGYAAVFNSPTDISEHGKRFTEVVRPGAFASSLRSGSDVICCFNHDPNRLLGRLSSGTLSLVEDSRGLRFSVELPDHEQAIKNLVTRGDLKGASFAFKVNGEKWEGSTRNLTDVTLIECGPVVQPAYPATSLGMRCKNYGLVLSLLERY